MSTDSTKEAMRFLLSDERIAEVMSKEFIEGFNDYKVACGSARAVRNTYERARQQDKARIEELTGLVQELLDALWDGTPTDASAGRDWNNAISKAKKLGFNPSTQ